MKEAKGTLRGWLARHEAGFRWFKRGLTGCLVIILSVIMSLRS